MNERIPADRLREAMRKANIEAMEDDAEEIGRQQAVAAVAAALTMPSPERHRPSEEEERQRDLDGALADAIEIVSRHRTRLGRRICIRSDGEIVRLIFEALRRMPSETSDLGFPS